MCARGWQFQTIRLPEIGIDMLRGRRRRYTESAQNHSQFDGVFVPPGGFANWQWNGVCEGELVVLWQVRMGVCWLSDFVCLAVWLCLGFGAFGR